VTATLIDGVRCRLRACRLLHQSVDVDFGALASSE
jgi:hypothetical protein